MKKDFTYFIAQTKTNVKNAYALTSSFWISVFSMVLNNLTFFVIWYLFMKATGPINGWTSVDVFGMLGVSIFCFGISNSFFRGIADLPEFVHNGKFDNVLLAPVNSFLKLSSSSFSVTAYGDLLLGMFVMIFYGIYMKFSLLLWTLFVVSTICGCVVFICIELLCSLVAFFIHDSSVLSRQMFEIFLRPGLYPGAIFPSGMKIFFMTIVPTLITSAVPIDLVKEKSISILLTAFTVTICWIVITALVYKYAIRRYESGNLLR